MTARRGSHRGRVLTYGPVLGILLVGYLGYRDYRSRQPPASSDAAGETCCLPGAEPRRAPQARMPEVLSGGSADQGRKVFVAACANCHDDDGSGARGRPLYPEIRDLRLTVRGSTIADTIADTIAEAVVYGRGQMPAFGGLVENDDIRDVIAFVRTLDR